MKKKRKKESFAAFICHQLYLHNPGGISESNASGKHLPGEQSAPTVHISLERRPSLSVTGVSFSTTKWQLPERKNIPIKFHFLGLDYMIILYDKTWLILVNSTG